MVRRMHCKGCEGVKPHLIRLREVTDENVTIFTLCVREYRFGNPCHEREIRTLTKGSWKALQEDDYE